MHRFIVLNSVCSKSGHELDDWGSFPPRGKFFFFFFSVTLSVQMSCFLSSLYFRVVSASETWMKHKADHISMYWHLIHFLAICMCVLLVFR